MALVATDEKAAVTQLAVVTVRRHSESGFYFSIVRLAVCVIVVALPLVIANSQTQNVPDQTHSKSPDTSPPPSQSAAASRSIQEEKHVRLFWIIPTYSVSNSRVPSRLSSHDKFHLFVKNATDPYTLGYTAFEAGISQAGDDSSGYGQGAAGYGKRLAAGLADETSSRFFTTYFFASLFRQDPRYFRGGSGPFKYRLRHALIRPLVTQTDSGRKAFNWSGLVGKTAASSLSNAYYPDNDRGLSPTLKRVAFAIPFSMLDHVIDEFGPDLERHFLRKK